MARFRSISRLLLLALLAAIVLYAPMLLKPVILLLSPFVNVSTIIASRTLTLATGGGLAVLLVCLVRKRFFCRWLCPLGLACETCGRIRSNRPSLCNFPDIGKGLALATIGGAIASAPFFLWLDPVILLSGAIGLAEPTDCIALGILMAAMAMSAVFPVIWCRKICPLGGLQELLAVPLTRVKTPDQKIEHGTRRAFLGAAAGLAGGFILRWIISPVSRRLRPPGAVAEDKYKTLCIRCGNCVRICPAKIIQHDTASPDTPGILAPMLGFTSDFCRADCNRCGQGCPSGAIAPLPLDAKNRRKIGLARIAMEDCLLTEGRECSICSLICPYNAIEEVFNQETYSYTLRVDPDRCNGCGQCQIVCPPKVIDIKPI